MGNNLNELASYFRPKAEALIAQANAAGLDVVVIDTGRTPQQQTLKIKQGVSWTSFSKHEPQEPEGLSEAIDLAPRAYLTMKQWNPSGELWQKLGALGEALGLLWGGRWKEHADLGHFEWVEPKNDLEDYAT